MQKRIKPDDISTRLKQYIEICTEAKSVLDHYFEEGDYFFHPDYGIDTVDKNLKNGLMFPSDPEYSTYKIPTSESIWLPTPEQIEGKLETPWIEEIMIILRKLQSYCQRFSSDEWPLE